jgi:hypothetical protein
MFASPGPAIATRPKRSTMIIGFIVIITLGMALRVWAAWQWQSNFNEDESIIGLMARHIIVGQFPVYFYGQFYLGSLEAIIASGFLKWFSPGVFSLRLGSLILYTLFFALQGIYTNRLWGRKVTLVSLLILALPGWWMLDFTYQSVVNYASLLLIATTVMLLVDIQRTQPGISLIRLLVIGILTGLGIWTHPMFVFYAFSLGLIYLLQSPEWSYFYHQPGKFFGIRLNGPSRLAGWGISLWVLSLLFLAAFTQGWQPEALFGILKLGAFVLLLVTGLIFAVVFFKASLRRWTLCLGALMLGIGFILGNLPQWVAWAFYRIRPVLISDPSPPAGIIVRVKMVSQWLFPAMWGIPPLSDVPGFDPPLVSLWHYHTWQVCFWLAVLALIISAFGFFFWKERNWFASLLALSPISPQGGKIPLLILLFLAPGISCLFTAKTDSIYAVRYLVISWQVGSIILALFVSRLMTWSRVLGGILIATVILVSIFNFLEVRNRWSHAHAWDQKNINLLAEYLTQKQVKGAYAEFGVADPLDFLTQERFSIASYNIFDRWAPYMRRARVAEFQTFILSRHAITSESIPGQDRIEDLYQYLSQVPQVLPDVLRQLAGQKLIDRHQVADWDIWFTTGP